jgi:hypothetical protein
MKKVFMFVLVVMLGVSFMGVSSVVAGECGPYGTGTPGYWKNHPDAWPVDEVWIGGTKFTQAQAIAIIDGPVRGDKWITMFKAYVAAYLNVQNDNCMPMCDTYYGVVNLGTAHSWLDFNQTLRPVKARSDEWQYSHGEIQYWCLDDYNNGLLDGIPSRDDLE